VLAAAAAGADRLVVGVDASAPAMAEASRRAGRRPERGGLPNALFVVAAAEALPPELDGLADLVTVHFPWGSLLRGLLKADPAVMAGVVRVMRPGAALSILVSSTARDAAAGVAPIGERTLADLAADYGGHGLAVTRVRPATPADVAATRSSWGRRLGAGARRPAWLLEAARLPGGSAELGQAGSGLVEPGRGRLQAGPRVGTGEPVGDGGHRVVPGVEALQLRPVERD
jgi:16S rRNA (adenine(1408)-N(1))-methyltransferase